MSLWLIFGLMAIVAAAFVVVPLVREARPLAAGLAVFTLAVAAGTYYAVGSPGTPSGAGGLPDVGDMVAGLAARLEERPDDLEGWRMLGRSYMQLGNYPGAVEAFTRAVDLSGGQDAQALVDLGEAHLSANNQQMTQRESALFENAIRIDPENQAAMFWSGIAAANRGQQELAATRWEKLLNSEPAPSADVARVLTTQIAQWRGVSVAAVAPPAPANAPGEPGIRINVNLSEAARADLPAEASVFVIARDPAQPRPPIAVQRRVLSELPASVTLTDRDAMIPGRNLSNFAEVEIVARVSVSGQPVQQAGDWFTSTTVETDSGDVLDLVISEQVQ